MHINQWPKHQKISTSQLKKALQKIKQTQLQVLSALKNEAQNLNINDSNPKITNQYIQANVPYIKSISHLNLLKMSEVTHMRKQFERERQKLQDKIVNLQQRIKSLELQIQLKHKLQMQWNQQKQTLYQKIKSLEQKSNGNSQSLVKAQVLSYKDSITEKIKDKFIIEDYVQKLKDQITQLQQQKQIYKTKYERIYKQNTQKQRNKFEKNMKMSQHLQKHKIPFGQMMGQIKKISNNHNKIYQSLKTRARITVTDLDAEQQIERSMNNILNLIEISQKHVANEQKKIMQIDDSAIQDGKVYDNQSFRDEVKKLDKQLFDHQHLRKEIYDLKTQILDLKEHKNSAQFQMLKLKENLSTCHQQLKIYEDKSSKPQGSGYQSLVIELERQMKNIRQQKNALANLVRKISQNAFNSNNDDFNKSMQEQLAQLTEINQRLKNQNQQYKIIIQSHKIQIQKITLQCQKLERQKGQAKIILQKQVRSKQKYQNQLNQKITSVEKCHQHINELKSMMESNSKRFQVDNKLKFAEISSIRLQNQKHLKQLRNLREIAYNFQIVSGQNQVLKRKLMQVNSTVIHLWQVKQAEYSNIYSILSQVKKQ